MNLTAVTGYVSPLSCAFPETLITRAGSTIIDTWPLRVYWLLLLCTMEQPLSRQAQPFQTPFYYEENTIEHRYGTF